MGKCTRYNQTCLHGCVQNVVLIHLRYATTLKRFVPVLLAWRKCHVTYRVSFDFPLDQSQSTWIGSIKRSFAWEEVDNAKVKLSK